MNAAKRVEHDQVGIPGDNVFGMATYGKFQELIVLWIAACNNLLIDVYSLRLARQSGKKTSNIFLADVPAELLSSKNLVKFRKGGKGEQDFPFSKCEIKSNPRFRIGRKQRAY